MGRWDGMREGYGWNRRAGRMCGLMALDLGQRSRASDLLLSMLYVFTSAFALVFTFQAGGSRCKYGGREWSGIRRKMWRIY
jgi:hypothetical protein